MNHIENRIKNIISEKLDINKEKIDYNLSFESDMHADSLDKIELIMALEEEFNLEITDEDAQKINTVKESIDYIKKKFSDKNNTK